MEIRKLLIPTMLALLLAGGGCGAADDPDPGGDPAGNQAADPSGQEPAGGADLDGTVPGCPLDAARVESVVGHPLPDTGNCQFSDGIKIVAVTTASQFAGATTYDFQRQEADDVYDQVTDLDVGDQAYLAVKDIAGELVVVSPAGSFTIVMNSFDLDPAGYERALLGLLDAVLG